MRSRGTARKRGLGLLTYGRRYEMELVRWRPRRHLPVLTADIDAAFDRMLRSWASPDLTSEFDWNPSVDIAETKDDIVVKAEIPGVKSDDIDVTVEDGRLILSGEKRQEEVDEGENYYRAERSYGSFRRIFSLPSQADTDNVEASYNEGVLTVTIPKTEVAKGKKVDIKSS
jgi:HSP20 family protein